MVEDVKKEEEKSWVEEVIDAYNHVDNTQRLDLKNLSYRDDPPFKWHNHQPEHNPNYESTQHPTCFHPNNGEPFTHIHNNVGLFAQIYAATLRHSTSTQTDSIKLATHGTHQPPHNTSRRDDFFMENTLRNKQHHDQTRPDTILIPPR